MDPEKVKTGPIYVPTPKPTKEIQPIPHCYCKTAIEDLRLITWIEERKAGLSENPHRSKELPKDQMEEFISSLLDRGVHEDAICIWTPRKFKVKRVIEIE